MSLNLRRKVRKLTTYTQNGQLDQWCTLTNIKEIIDTLRRMQVITPE